MSDDDTILPLSPEFLLQFINNGIKNRQETPIINEDIDAFVLGIGLTNGMLFQKYINKENIGCIRFYK